MIKKHSTNFQRKRIISKSTFEKLDSTCFDSTRSGFGEGVVKASKQDSNVVVLCADLSDSMKLGEFKKIYPKRFFQVGVSEQHLMGAASGMSHVGKIPFAVSYAAFNPGRNWDFFRVASCYSQNKVIVVGGHAGLTTGPDGATHQALEDVALMRSIPNMTIVVPCDQVQAEKATLALSSYEKSSYLRLSREKGMSITNKDTSFSLGKADVLDDGEDVVIVACGIALQFALEAREQLKYQGISAAVLNMHTIRPLDEKTLKRYAQKCGAVVSVEEHQKRGGLGSEIAEFLSQNYPVYQEFVGVDDSFGESGQGYDLLKKYGISTKEIVKKTKKVLKKKEEMSV